MADESNAGLREQVCRAELASEAEVEWFFKCTKGNVPHEGDFAPELREAAMAVRDWLDAIPTFHVGALKLRFTPRAWPQVLEGEFGSWTSLVVRLDCAKHPSEVQQDVPGLEAAAVRRLETAIAEGRSPRERARLRAHAEQHVRSAIRAYMKVRGVGPSVLAHGAKGGA